jgi:hypothetical protein
MTNYEKFNSSLKSFRIFCDKLSSVNRSKNLIIESSDNAIELKVQNGKKIIFNNDIVFNETSAMNLNNKPLTGLNSITCENVDLFNIFSTSNINITNKASFFNFSFETTNNEIQDLRDSFYNIINLYNNSSVIVDINATLSCSYSLNERITIELWRDLSMISKSNNLGSVNAAGGILIPFSLTYFDTNLSSGDKKYYLKYKLENNTLVSQGIINVNTSESGSTSNIILREIVNASNYSNKTIFGSTKFVTTSYEIQDLSMVFYNIISVANSDVQININVNLYCCYDYNERISVEVWRDSSMISQSKELGTVNATAGLTIPYSFNYLDKNAGNGDKKYYLKYKLEKDVSNNNSNSIEAQGLVNINTLDSSGSSVILLANVAKNNNNLSTASTNSFLTTTSDLQDLSSILYNNIDVNSPSAILVNLNITLFACYASDERITVELWRDSIMISNNLNIGPINATGGLTIDFRLSLLDETVDAGRTKYYLKYKLESNLSARAQGIVNVRGTYNIIENFNRGISYKVLSYKNMNNGYVLNTKIGYAPSIINDKGSAIGRRDAYFTYIDISGADSLFNNSLYVKKNISVGGSATIRDDFTVRNITLNNIYNSLNIIKDIVYNTVVDSDTTLTINSIVAGDLSASNITISNELYVYNKYYMNNLSIRGQILSNVLKVPSIFTIDPLQYNNNSGTLAINGDVLIKGNKTQLGSTIVDISGFTLKIANNLLNISDLLTNPAGFDVSNNASLKYNGVKWNFNGEKLLVGSTIVGYDVSLVNLQTNIYASLAASKSIYTISFGLLQINIDSSFNNVYTKSSLNNSFVTKLDADNSYIIFKNSIAGSFLLKQTYNISENNMLQNYAIKANIDESLTNINRKIDLSFVLQNILELSYNDLKNQFEASFNNIVHKKFDVDVSTIYVETIQTNELALCSNVTISGDLIVTGDMSINSLNISNTYIFNSNGYSSIYLNDSNNGSIIEEYYSNFNNGKVIYINADGSLYYQSGKGALSDSRLKECIVDAAPKLQDLLKVRVIDYNLHNNPTEKYIGVLAQELEKIFPGLVSDNAPSAKEIEYGKTENYKSVKYSCFNVMLIKALQEQQENITNLSLRLERLKHKHRTYI